MEITLFIFVVPVSLFIAIFKPKWLIYLLVVSLSLQVSSIINIGDYSLQIYRFLTILLSVLFLLNITFNGFILKFPDKNAKRIFIYGLLFSIYTFFHSIIAPFIFSGYPVHPGYLGIDFSVMYGPFPLHFSKYNVAFSIYIIFYVLTLGSILLMRWNYKDVLLLQKSFRLAIFIVFSTALSQILSYSFGIFDITEIFYTSSAREFEYSLVGEFLLIPRLQATYYEPSMLAPFIVSVFTIYFYNFLNKGKIKDLIISFLSLIIIILSTSTTAYVALIIIFITIILTNMPFKLRRHFTFFLLKGKLRSYIHAATFILIVFIFFIHFIVGWENLIKIVELYLLKKSETSSFNSRTTSDIHALKLFLDTYGFGVGLGSNRPSSLLPYLLSQLGLLGTLLFLIFIFSILKFTFNALKNSDFFKYFFPLPIVLVTQLIAYPDITNPTLWQFIYISTIISVWRIRYGNLP